VRPERTFYKIIKVAVIKISDCNANIVCCSETHRKSDRTGIIIYARDAPLQTHQITNVCELSFTDRNNTNCVRVIIKFIYLPAN